MFDYNNATNNTDTIYCRDNVSDSVSVSSRNCGNYANKPPKIEVLCKANDMTLRAVVKSFGTTYEIVCDGEVFSFCYNRAEAEQMFMDFTGITKAKLKKLYAEAEEAKKKAA